MISGKFSENPARFTAILALWQKHTGLNVLAIFTIGDPTFQYRSLIGGEKVSRGYFEGRYRDRNLLGGQAEYRFPISKRFKVVAFASAGRIWGQETFR